MTARFDDIPGWWSVYDDDGRCIETNLTESEAAELAVSLVTIP